MIPLPNDAIITGMDNGCSVSEAERMEDQIVITTNDYQRLTGLIGFASLREKMPDAVNLLNGKLRKAKMLEQDKVSRTVITMNSCILLRDISLGREAKVTLAYPQDADAREGKISVFSSVGIALLGRKVGDRVSWKIPGGMGHFEITEIIFQPEAVGHYHL
jgi:regulator of nucleoside diphosphate kinase